LLLIAEGVCGQVFADILVFEKDGWLLFADKEEVQYF